MAPTDVSACAQYVHPERYPRGSKRHEENLGRFNDFPLDWHRWGIYGENEGAQPWLWDQDFTFEVCLARSGKLPRTRTYISIFPPSTPGVRKRPARVWPESRPGFPLAQSRKAGRGGHRSEPRIQVRSGGGGNPSPPGTCCLGLSPSPLQILLTAHK